ncbi:MAG: hypothetical protein VYD53_07600, partial [Pseudomonadota bacterium]|nr:hypothetical protein [Pseudomonadota bacterium]
FAFPNGCSSKRCDAIIDPVLIFYFKVLKINNKVGVSRLPESNSKTNLLKKLTLGWYAADWI